MRAAGWFAALALGGLTASQQPALRVLRVNPSPQTPGEPASVVTVTFDRPVAGQLDGTVDPRTIFAIAPAVDGKVEWRDPITLRFTPAVPLTPSASYTVTVASTFQAMDGSKLAEPYRFTFRVGAPRVLTVRPAGPRADRRFLPQDAQFEMVVSAPVELAVASRLVYLQLSGTCDAPPVVHLNAVTQRPVPQDTSRLGRFQAYRAYGGPVSDLARIVRLVPEQTLPKACDGSVMYPARLDPATTAQFSGLTFATYGPFRLVRLSCPWYWCPTGHATLEFSTPVHGADVVRAVSASPAVKIAVGDTGDDAHVWELDAKLRPRTAYRFTVDSTLRDVFGQPLTGPRIDSLHTTGFMPMLDYATGSMVVERQSYRTLAVKHVNLDTLFVTLAPVSESLMARVVAAPEWNLADVWPLLAKGATSRTIPVPGPRDAPLVSAVKLPAYNAALPGSPTLTAVRVLGSRNDTTFEHRREIALVQVTDLAVTAKLGAEEAAVWVTTMHDGRPSAGAAVVLYDRRGRVRGRGTTDARGLARLTALAPDSTANEERSYYGSGGYVTATLGSDRAVVSLDTWELSPWQFNVSAADRTERLPAAAGVFTERGIYRPGETVHAKAIVRAGSLGALRVPAAGDSLHWVFSDREEGKLRDTTVALSAFGTADQALAIPPDLPLGTYRVGVGLKRGGSWVELGTTSYRVAEYRPPEFLVTATGDSAPHFAGDTLAVTVEARYLFGAPMGRAEVTWSVRTTPVGGWGISVPGTEGYTLGETGWWWEEEGGAPAVDVTEGRIDTTDATGHLVLHAVAGAPKKGRAARVTIEATVTDVNRQTVSASASATVHPAAFYVGAKPLGDDYFWRAGQPESIAVIAVEPAGRRVSGVAVSGTVVRREWHRVLRARAGLDEQVGEWVADTVARCDLTTAAEPVLCRFTPQDGGSYVLGFRAKDTAGREASTSFYRWATGKGWVPWADESQFKMDVIPDKTTYAVGDTATVLFASPFTDAEAWITVEREGIIEQRRLRLTSGATSLKLPLTEAYVPNAFVGIVVARGRSARPGSIGDPGRPALRVGYAQLLVTPAVKRLKVDLQSAAAEYRPGDTARVRLHVSDAAGAGARSEVTLWAVDEGVLSLTGYRTPDPIALLYQPRGLGMRLGSDLVSVATQVLDSEGVSIKGEREPGGGGGLEGGEVLRSRFSSTAFFLGSVVTDADGNATAAAKLPDNLTTFRLMAVAVTAGDRYGSGQSSLLVTRPLLARPALPRFLRRDDHFLAGVVVNQRAGGTPTVGVRARVRGVALADASAKTATLMAGRGTEVRFDFRDTTSDTAVFRFDVGGGGDSDAVLSRLPVRPAFFPRAHAVSGTVRWRDTVAFTLPGDIAPERSRLVFSLGVTPLAVVGGMYLQLAVYPFDCSEQVSDEMLPLVALLKAQAAGGGTLAPADARRQLADGVDALSRRQRTDGGIGLWAADDWTTPWLSAYAGEALLGARSVGVAVNDSVLIRLAQYLYRSVHQRPPIAAPVADWFRDLQVRLGEDVAAVDFMSLLGRADVAGENELLREAAQLAWKDRVRLAEVLARRGATDAGQRLLAPIWAGVRVEGRRAVIPDSAHHSFYFWSYRRPVARLLTATLAVDSTSPLVGPLVETLVEEQRDASRWWWNTQDYGAAVEALAAFAERQRRAGARGYSVVAGGRQLFTSDRGRAAAGEFSTPLTGLLVPGADGSQRLSLVVAVQPTPDSLPLFYYANVEEIPLRQPVTPDQQGIAVERWYEDYSTGKPIISAPEGSLVRVRLRITVPAERRFLALSDPLPAGLEAVDLSLRTSGGLPGPGGARRRAGRVDEEGEEPSEENQGGYLYGWYYGSWDGGWWSPFDHREMRDDRVAWFATYLWPGTYTASYVARATTPGVFVRPPAHAEEMYNPSVQGRTDGGVFTVTPKTP